MVPKGTELVIVPSCVEELGDDAFRDCQKLRRIVFLSGCRVGKIGAQCFRGSGLEEMVIPASVRILKAGAFCRCAKMKRVLLEKGSRLERVEDYAFSETKLQHKIRFPPDTYVSQSAFEG